MDRHTHDDGLRSWLAVDTVNTWDRWMFPDSTPSARFRKSAWWWAYAIRWSNPELPRTSDGGGSMLDWLWSCSRMGERGYARRARHAQSPEAMDTGSRAVGLDGSTVRRLDVLMGREKHTSDPSSWAAYVTSPSICLQRAGKVEDGLLDESLRARSIHDNDERDGCGRRERQESLNGSWESSMGSAGSLRRLVGGERGTAPALVDPASVFGMNIVDLQCVRVLLLS